MNGYGNMTDVLDMLDSVSRKLNAMPTSEELFSYFKTLEQKIREFGELAYANSAKIDQLTQMVSAICKVNGIEPSIQENSGNSLGDPFGDEGEKTAGILR